MDFLRAAAGIAGTSVYSLHKTSTRDFIQKFAVKTLGLATGAATVVAQLRYDLPPTYAFHRWADQGLEVGQGAKRVFFGQGITLTGQKGQPTGSLRGLEDTA